MDDLLKSSARKRREEAGEPFTMHPATRKLLQGEVARVYPKAPPRWSRWLAFWPRVGFAAATLAVLLTVMLIVIPNHERQSEMARTVPSSASAPVEAEVLSSRDEELADKDRDSLRVKSEDRRDMFEKAPAPAADEKKQVVKELDGIARQERPLPGTVPPPMVADSSGLKRAEPGSGKEDMERAKSKLADRESNVALKSVEELGKLASDQPAAAAKPKDTSLSFVQQTNTNRVMLGVELAQRPASQSVTEAIVPRSRYIQMPAQQTGVAGAFSNTAQPVLNSFEFEKTGDQIRITDADGSVYQGQVLSQTLGDTTNATLGRRVLNTQAGSLPEVQSGLEAAQSQQTYFRASGTNRSLRKNVTIEASFSAPALQQQNVAGGTVNAPAPSGPQQPVARNRSAIQNEARQYGTAPAPQPINARIQGRAQIGTNQEVQIQAVPAPR